VPDLHDWITQQITLAVAVAEEAADGAGSAHWRAAETASCDCCVHLRTEDGGLLCTPDSRYADHMAAHDPAAVLRRCEADRRILTRHRLNPDAYWSEAAACHGCGTFGDCDDPVTDNLNDCPELLDLAHAHGLTPEILADLDRPQRGERPEPSVFRIGPPARPTSSVPSALRGPNWKAQP
jgi:hypothetical protein